MLLQRLAEHARTQPHTRPFHRALGFRWELRLNHDGTPAATSLESVTTTDAKGKARLAEHIVPATVRTVGVAPNLAADDVQYVLGWADPTTRTDRVARCHAAFVDLTRRWAQTHPDDPAAAALIAFYDRGGPDLIERADDIAAKDRVLVTVGGRFAHDATTAASFWSHEVTNRKGSANSGLCLVCGTTGSLLDTIPSKVPAKLVPGASNDTALISVNERAFGYDLTEQLACTPICVGCGEAVSNGLVSVLSSPHTLNYSGENTRLAWWTVDAAEFDPVNVVINGTPAEIDQLLNAFRKADKNRAKTIGDGIDPARFCALSIGGNVARIMVRDWIDMPLDDLRTNIGRWFADHEITPRWPGEPTCHTLSRLVTCTGRWLRQERRYAFLGAKGAHRPDGIQNDLLRSALRGTPVPPSVLTHLINRIRTDGHLDNPRAALLRLSLTRACTASTEKPLPSLNTTSRDPAYVSGRIFATLENIQITALGRDLNTTYGDRYFASAADHPQMVLINGRKEAKAWLGKLRRNDKTRGAAVKLSDTLDELFDLIEHKPGIPRRTTVSQQGAFMLGYHHQRASDQRSRAHAQTKAKAKNNVANDSEDPTP
ncbi:type I-C CRISPR-associated protein Cas8c/Csd1 [Actinokineospora guangxiensis]|uniref:Type I-C CRISPR-associated protein Cas8c/Csd1 n=1 Tax=Actinokineospora guangxiensis TaxID=1490288 RepID=A0ABW0ETI0_9PSEU